jgi:hypothetical protein
MIQMRDGWETIFSEMKLKTNHSLQVWRVQSPEFNIFLVSQEATAYIKPLVTIAPFLQTCFISPFCKYDPFWSHVPSFFSLRLFLISGLLLRPLCNHASHTGLIVSRLASCLSLAQHIFEPQVGDSIIIRNVSEYLPDYVTSLQKSWSPSSLKLWEA